MKSIALCSLLCLTCTLCFGQQSDGYVLPFASTGNRIELAVENTAQMKSSDISVEAKSFPAWITFTKQLETIPEISGNSEQMAGFAFSVEKTAPIGKTEKITFLVSSPNGQTWTKEIIVSVAPPERFELFQNYPNPLNPTTTIGYQLKSDSRVSLKIYNLIGQEVATLVNGDRTAGYHQELWNASSVASGAYIYRLVAKDEAGKQVVVQKLMMVLK